MTLSDDQRYQEYLRIKAGFQCPECFGVNIEEGQMYWGKDGFQCTDCGCWWTEMLSRSGQSNEHILS